MLDSDWVVSPFVPIGCYALLLLLRGVRDAGTWEGGGAQCLMVGSGKWGTRGFGTWRPLGFSGSQDFQVTSATVGFGWDIKLIA